MKNIIIVLTVIVIASCTKGGKLTGVNGDVYTVTAAATSKQLIPAIDTTSTGSFTGLYDQETNNLTGTIAWNDLWRDTQKDTVTSVGIYGPSSATSNGSLVRSLPFVNTNKASSINIGLSGRTGFTEGEQGDLLAGSYYFTINTKRYPNGIVRGQLTLAQK